MKKYIIGKPRKYLAIFNIIIWMPFATMLIICEIYYQSPIVNGIVLGLLIIIINLLIAGPAIYSSGMWWSVDDKVLKYSIFKKFSSRIKAFYLHDNYTNYYFSLKIEQISKIDLGWHNVPIFPFGLIGHPITFTIEMKDGSIIELEVLYTRESKKFVAACDYISSLGVVINDHYQLLPVIADPALMVSQYIEDLERGGMHD